MTSRKPARYRARLCNGKTLRSGDRTALVARVRATLALLATRDGADHAALWAEVSAASGVALARYVVNEHGVPHRDGAAPEGRPPLPPGERRVLLAVRLPPAVLARLDELRRAAGETRTATVERLVRDAK